MKKTARKDAIRNIWKKKVSWISIVIVICITVCGYLGTSLYSDAMKRDGVSFYKKYNFKDIDVISVTGILPEELEGFKKIEGVADVEGLQMLAVSVSKNGTTWLVPMIRKTERISVPVPVSGVLPEKKDEIAISVELAKKMEASVGDTISLSVDEKLKNYLYGVDYKVVGIVNHPDYSEIKDADFLLAADPAFNSKDSLNGGYTRALIKVDYPEDLDIFSDKYFDTIAEVEARIRATFPELTVTHEKELREAAERKIEEETAGPRQKLEDGKEKLKEAKKALEDGEKTLTDSGKQLDDAKKKLEDGKKQLDDGKKQLDGVKKQITDGEKKLAEGKKQFQTKKSDLTGKLNEGKERLKQAEDEADAGIEKLSQGSSLLNMVGSMTGDSSFSEKVKKIQDDLVGYYKPAMQAAVQQKDYAQLLKEAEEKTNTKADRLISWLLGNEKIKDPNLKEALSYAAFMKGQENAYSFLSAIVEQEGITGEKVDVLLNYLKTDGKKLTVAELAKTVDTIEALRNVQDLKIKNFGKKLKDLIRQYFNGYGKAYAAKDAIKDAKALLSQQEKLLNDELSKAEKQLKDAEKTLDDVKKKYEEGKATYEKSAKQYEDGKKKYEDGLKQYEDGKKQLEEKKKEYEDGQKKVQDAEKQLSDKTAELREKIDDMIRGSFAVQTRRANKGYMSLKAILNTVSMGAAAFIGLFLLISAMVAFSTIVIIIDEQRTQVGTMKSQGFFNGMIRNKYLVFGLSAAFTGIIIGLGLGMLASHFFRNGMALQFVYGQPKFIFSISPIVISTVLVVLVIVAAVVLACRTILKMSAVQLMNGEVKMRRHKNKKRSGSLYGHLIRRNMRTELPRVVITILIITASCGSIGFGFTMKYAFQGMTEKQTGDVWGYDVRVNYSPETKEETIKKLEKVITDAGAEYAAGAEIGTLYRINDVQEYTYLLVLDQEIVSDYYHVRDWTTGEEMQLPDDGVLIMNRLMENSGLNTGDTFTLFDERLFEHTVTIKGVYTNYIGRTVIMSGQAYYDLFGTKAKNNHFMIRLKGADLKTLENKMKEVLPEITLSSAEALTESYESLQASFDSVVYMMTGLAIMMSIFILANLTNIFVSRRTKEMIIMRVNGFSTRQCIGYLVRESVISTVTGLILAVILGSLISRNLVMLVEQPETMLNRSFMPKCWVFAILMESAFAFMIDAIAFRKVKKLKVTDIAEAS